MGSHLACISTSSFWPTGVPEGGESCLFNRGFGRGCFFAVILIPTTFWRDPLNSF
jgi:hypothetical protein